MPRRQEENLHSAISTYIKLRYPDVIFTAESSGIRVGQHIAKTMKRQRSRDKQIDMIIDEPRGQYHGLRIELKKDRKEIYLKDGGYSKKEHVQEQLKTVNKYKAKGYYAGFACGLDEAMKIVDYYMALKPNY